MAASRSSTRYAAVESCSSSSSHGPSPAADIRKLSSMKNLTSNFSCRRKPCDLIGTGDSSSRALAKNHPPSFGTMVKKFMEKRSNSRLGMPRRVELAIPVDVIAEDLKKAVAKGSGGGGLSNLHRKIFNRTGSADRTPKKALTEVTNNTRTLGMVLRSERELLRQKGEYEEQIAELRLLVEEKNLEVEKLKDLCLKQREEIKALKDAILFPDVNDRRVHDLFETQSSELKEARKIIPCIQKQVSSLTGQIQCLAEDLAEVKADKYAAKNCFEGHVSSPRTPKLDKGFPEILEYSPGDTLRIDDINPCLTPCFSRIKSKEYEAMCYNSPSREKLFQDSNEMSPDFTSDSYSGMLSRSSGHFKDRSIGVTPAIKIYKSDESRRFFGKQRPQSFLK